MFSAKKVGGKKLYEHARKGEVIDRQPVQVVISTLEVLGDKNPVATAPGSDAKIRIRVVCSAGSYIRQLAEDIGRKVGVGAHLTELRRTRAGRFGLSEAFTLEQLAEGEDPIACLRPVDAAVEHLPAITITPDRVEKTRNGLSTRVETAFEPGTAVQMRDEGGELIGIGVFDDAESAIRPKVVLI
jgi:tRNA pseudouridine55 synthase